MASLEIEARLDNLLSAAQAETTNIDLFAPIQEKEECPICLIPLPLYDDEVRFMICCGKRICIGCNCKDIIAKRKKGTPINEEKCAFCCQPPPKNIIKALKKLMKKKNPDAFYTMAGYYERGDGVIQSNTKSLEMYACAAELGHAHAYTLIARHYKRGIVVEQDSSKELEYLQISAKKGFMIAHELLSFEGENADEGIQHLVVAANAGYKHSLDLLMDLYKGKGKINSLTKFKGKVLSKEELTKTLLAFQSSSNTMKSKDRDDARTYFGRSPR